MWGQAFDLMTEYALILNFITLYHGILSPIFVPQMVMCHGTLLFQQVWCLFYAARVNNEGIRNLDSVGEFHQ